MMSDEKPAKRKGGRPSKLAAARDEICRRLAGGESLRAICATEGMPAMSTVLLWVVTDSQEFSEQYLRAREAAGYAHADRALSVIDALGNGAIEANAARVMLLGLQWAAERMAPKRHSPRQEVVGAEGGAIKHQFVAPDQYDEGQWARRHGS